MCENQAPRLGAMKDRNGPSRPLLSGGRIWGGGDWHAYVKPSLTRSTISKKKNGEN